MFNYFTLKEIENGNASLDLNVLHSLKSLHCSYFMPYSLNGIQM